ncbi:hypothetical protein C7441_1095 [Pseudaminobacter salicylatoxidans]|uniref:Uncharacterized protein n=1 Tax=Pseudaminobacter salicylatoxidans TaxID=93369 RepID=A0A316CML6_PSESE|nr:hypothetical protein C7441_1095 [Pseudaminobacter salicylatoxidans]
MVSWPVGASPRASAPGILGAITTRPVFWTLNCDLCCVSSQLLKPLLFNRELARRFKLITAEVGRMSLKASCCRVDFSTRRTSGPAVSSRQEMRSGQLAGQDITQDLGDLFGMFRDCKGGSIDLLQGVLMVWPMQNDQRFPQS